MDVAQPPNHAYTILRIKRKRTEEPLDALGMHLATHGGHRATLRHRSCCIDTQSSNRDSGGKNHARASTCSSSPRRSSTTLGKTARQGRVSRWLASLAHAPLLMLDSSLCVSPRSRGWLKTRMRVRDRKRRPAQSRNFLPEPIMGLDDMPSEQQAMGKVQERRDAPLARMSP